MKTHTSEHTPRRRKVHHFEQAETFYVGSVQNEGEPSLRLLCFRNAVTGSVGASQRFSRQEAYRKSKCGRLKALVGDEGPCMA